MEKMNQVSVSEFFAKSKEEMYDMAVEMVEKYNRLVDICNDSAERMAELIERHKVYTNALNKDIADKASKIELLEKEIEGRKEGYWALKEKYDKLEEELNDKNEEIEKLKKSFNALKEEMATRYITIETHNSICETYDKKVAELEKELADRNVKIRHQKENLDGINKTLEIRTKENESLIKVRNNLNKEIEAHESENARLTERIIGLKEEVKKRDKCINTGNEAIVNLRKQIGEREEENKRLSEKIMKLHDTITELSHDIDNYKSWNSSLHKDIKELKKKKEDDHGKSGFKRYIEHLIEEEERAVPERFKERLNEEITAIFTKEEETVKYRPSEIDRFTNFLKDEVDKKRIVDIRYGVEDDLHVTRDLLVAAVKLIVAKGYHEYDGVTTDYGRFHVLTTPDVEFKDLYDTWKIKSIGPDIPCGEDAIE